LCGYTTGLRWTRHGRSVWSVVRGLEILVPDGVGARSLAVLGGNPLHGSDTLGFTDGDYPWNLSLGQRLSSLVMGNWMGRHFQDDESSKHPCLCYILYVEQWRFHCSMPSDHREGGPRSSMPWQAHVCCSIFDKLFKIDVVTTHSDV
jgi:hypothetical protein